MDASYTPFEALKAAVETIGSQSGFARLLGVSQTSVWKWLQSGKRLPAEHVLTVEAKTGVSKHLLRPDIYPLTSANPTVTSIEPTVGNCGPIVSCNRPTISKRRARA